MVAAWWFFTPEMWHDLGVAAMALLGVAAVIGLVVGAGVWLDRR